ncbi:MAG: ATP-binding protein [Firmicutes bacterium]|nr:ATP-binding protein [Bacillota bacterium]
MTKRIFRAVCAASLVVFAVTMLLILGALYDYFSSIQSSRLKAETALAAQGVELSGLRYFDGLDTAQYRVTWIASDGSVLYDSVSDSDAMENHLLRQEIQEAMTTGFGESTRYSSTLMQRFLYCAQRLSDGTVIRLSESHGSVLLLLIGMIRPILILMVVAAVLSFILAGRLSRRIVEPLNRLNLEEPLENEEYDELAPLLRRINSQQTQLRQQAATLRQKQNELDTIVGSMQEGMVLLDQRGKIISINRSAKTLLDAPYAGFGDQLLTVSRNPELQQAVEAASNGQSTAIRAELQGRIIQISAAPVMSENGISGAAMVFFDITQREKAEQQRREFTANVSHELKTPLQSISGYSELMKLGMVKPEDVQPFAGKIYGEAQRLISLVEDIISLSHLDEGGKDLRWSDVDLYASAEDVIQSLTALAAESQVSLALEGGHCQVHGVPELIHGILYNLCDNAIKYNRPGGTVTVTVEDRTVTVKDTGIGIPPEQLDRIFERFYRVDKSRSKEVGGTGLGLSIVKHAAKIHQAQIDVSSTVGEGTVIAVHF